MIKKIIFQIILIFITLTVQLGFIDNLFSPINHFNLILSLIIFIVVIFNLSLALLWLIVSGLILDTLSLTTFGIYLISLFLTAIIINFLFRRFFTNKSIYTVSILGLAGTVLYKTFLLTFNSLLFYFKLNDLQIIISKVLIMSISWQTVLNLIFLIILFIIVWYTSRKLKSHFLDHVNQM